MRTTPTTLDSLHLVRRSGALVWIAKNRKHITGKKMRVLFFFSRTTRQNGYVTPGKS